MKEKKIWRESNETDSHLKFGKHIQKNIDTLNNLLSQAKISKNDLQYVLDWGPGGGWLSREISGTSLILFDIVESHEQIQRRNCKNKFQQIEFYDVSGERYPTLSGQIDIAIMFSVIYHMPSLKYVENAIKQLNNYKPKYIAIRNMFTTEDSWECKDFKTSTFLRMNVVNRDAFIGLFPEYKIVAKTNPEKAATLNGVDCFSQSLIFKRTME